MQLAVKNLKVSYDKIKALHGINFSVDQGEIVTIIGANGAGKSTTLRAISRMIPSEPGSKIEFMGTDILRYSTDKIVSRLGISHVPEGRRLFPNMTVLENLVVGAYNSNVWSQRNNMIENIYKFFPILKERKNQLAGTLSGGEQQMLAIGRALMSKPSLLMLDEPSLGLAPKIVEAIFEIIIDINKKGVTILLIEQNVQIALQIAHRAYVMESGSIKLEGEANMLIQNEHIKKTYLGL